MRDHVEIGIGREARKAYNLSQIRVAPSRRTRSSKDVDISWHIDAYSFDLPIMSEPTDALAGPEFVKEMDKQGGLAVINAEGLWGRHPDLDAAVTELIDAVQKDYDTAEERFFSQYCSGGFESAAIATLQRFHSAPLNMDLLAERLAQVRDSGVTLAVRVSPQHARDLAPAIVKAGADLLIVQGTIISAQHVARSGDTLDLKDFVPGLDVPVIAGGVTDYSTALHLMRTGAAGVIVGDGGTSGRTLGLNIPLATAIADVAAARRDYLDETGGRYVHVIAHGVRDGVDDIVASLACGADAVMLGRQLAGAEEAAGRGYFWPSVAAHPRYPRGEVIEETDTVIPLEKLLHGPTTRPYGMVNLVGGVRRAMAKCGYTDVKSFQKAPLIVEA